MTTEDLAALGRRELWQRIKTHTSKCECRECLEWASRWDLVERSILQAAPHE